MVRFHILIACMIGFGSLAWADSHATEEAAVSDLGELKVDLDAAAKIYKKSCRACHGRDAQGAASYPGLADLEPDYIKEKLEIYRSGQKIGPNSILMIQHAKKLSDEDIANLSVFVATAFD